MSLNARQRLLHIYSMMVKSEAPSDMCVVCLTHLNKDHGHSNGLICSERCDKLVTDIIALCNQNKRNIAHKFDALAQSVDRLREKRLYQ